jgi:hypothetical protein
MVEKGLGNSEDVRSKLTKVSLLSEKDLHILRLSFDEKAGGTIDGPLNWYRTRKVNHEEDQGEPFSMLQF